MENCLALELFLHLVVGGICSVFDVLTVLVACSGNAEILSL